AADQPEARGLSHGAQQVLDFLRQRGASFFADIVRGTGKLKAEIETALWELVAAGVVTADGFDNLRSLIDPKRRAGQGSGRMARPRHSAGRWALLSGRVTVPGAGHCSIQIKPPITTARLKPPAGCCSSVMVWFSATCWRVKPICRSGANFRLLSAVWKIVAKFAAAVLWMVSSASSSH